GAISRCRLSADVRWIWLVRIQHHLAPRKARKRRSQDVATSCNEHRLPARSGRSVKSPQLSGGGEAKIAHFLPSPGPTTPDRTGREPDFPGGAAPWRA